MNVAQVENRDTARLDSFTDPLPSTTTLGLLKALCRQHESLETLIKAAKFELAKHDRLHPALRDQSIIYRSCLVNRVTQAALRQREVLNEIIEVGSWLKAEAAALDVVTN